MMICRLCPGDLALCVSSWQHSSGQCDKRSLHRCAAVFQHVHTAGFLLDTALFMGDSTGSGVILRCPGAFRSPGAIMMSQQQRLQLCRCMHLQWLAPHTSRRAGPVASRDRPRSSVIPGATSGRRTKAT